MADEDDASKTEDPTEKKLQDARRKGQVASSQEIKSWAILLGGTAGLIILAPYIANNVRIISQTFIENPHAISMDSYHLREVFKTITVDIGLVLAPLFLILVILAIALSPMRLIISSEAPINLILCSLHNFENLAFSDKKP